MNVELLKEEDNTTFLKISETTPHYMNTLRRLLMNEVPVMAVEEVEFRQNSSILYDEIVAHRLGLIALKTDLESYELPEECKCEGEGCEECQVTLTLQKEAGEDEQVMVYADDIESADPEVKPIHQKTPIVQLNPNQKLECEMKAQLGKGEEHAKWSGCHAWFKYYPYVEVEEQPENPEKIAEKFPPVLEVEEGDLVVNEEALWSHDIIDEEIEEKTEGAVSYEERDDFVFAIETWGPLSVEELIEKAVEIHNDQLDEFQEKLSEV